MPPCRLEIAAISGTDSGFHKNVAMSTCEFPSRSGAASSKPNIILNCAPFGVSLRFDPCEGKSLRLLVRSRLLFFCKNVSGSLDATSSSKVVRSQVALSLSSLYQTICLRVSLYIYIYLSERERQSQLSVLFLGLCNFRVRLVHCD